MNILVLTGGLEEDPFTAALAKALRALDHRVTTLSPLYRSIDPGQRALARRLVKLNVEVEGTPYACELYTGRNVHGVEQVFIGHPELFATANDLDDGDAATVQRRLRVFSLAAAAFVRDDITVGAEIIHGLGEAGTAVLRELAEADHPTPRVLSADADALTRSLDIATTLIAATTSEADRVLEALAARHADDRAGKFVRVVGSGVDTSLWNPLTDSHLASRFDPIDRSGKARSKAALQRELALPVRPEVPLLGVVVRAQDSRYLSAFVNATAELLRNDVQLVVQADASGEAVAALEDLWDRFPDRFQVRTGSDGSLTHAIMGASDLLLSLSDDGAFAREAQRYGTLPILSRQAPLADVLVDCDATLSSGNAFLSDSLDAKDVLAATQRAVGAYLQREGYKALVRRVMELDNSWTRAAHGFVRAYKSALPAVEGEAA
ncbi:MAG: glycogen/starch synthase [Polyangiales bacterium]|nr:glycogen/starch synthase [Myxococcales bacterium]MCB9661561.1 glycogen/starch synthase [Sandaracinaceae bacterium]